MYLDNYYKVATTMPSRDIAVMRYLIYFVKGGVAEGREGPEGRQGRAGFASTSAKATADKKASGFVITTPRQDAAPRRDNTAELARRMNTRGAQALHGLVPQSGLGSYLKIQ